MILRVTQSLDFGRKFGTSLHLLPDHCLVDTCRRQDEFSPDVSTKKSVLDDGISCMSLHTYTCVHHVNMHEHTCAIHKTIFEC